MKTTNRTSEFNETVDQFRSSAHSAVDKTANATVHAAKAFSKKGDQLKNAEAQYMEQFRNYVHEKPLASFGLAMGVGFLLNHLLSDH